MDTIEAISARRAVKCFDPAHQMSEEEIEKLLSLAILSPTAFNIQHWRFVRVSDPELRQEIRKVDWDQAQVTDSSLFLIVCANLKAWNEQPERYWHNAPKEVQDFLVPAIGQYYSGNEQVERDEALRSCGIAAQTIMLAAKAMGYDSCPMDGFDFEAVGKLIRLPENHIITLAIAVGKGVKQPWPRPGQLPLSSVVVRDRF